MPDILQERIGSLLTGSGPFHASCVAHQGKGVLICGASGSGKSGLALQLMALGAELVADDRVILKAEDGEMLASAPAQIAGKIEARGIGILNAKALPSAPVHVVIALDHAEKARLPEQYTITRLGITLPLLFRVDSPHFPSAIVHYLHHGRNA